MWTQIKTRMAWLKGKERGRGSTRTGEVVVKESKLASAFSNNLK
jgi:hypothetical protein